VKYRSKTAADRADPTWYGTLATGNTRIRHLVKALRRIRRKRVVYSTVIQTCSKSTPCFSKQLNSPVCVVPYTRPASNCCRRGGVASGWGRGRVRLWGESHPRRGAAPGVDSPLPLTSICKAVGNTCYQLAGAASLFHRFSTYPPLKRESACVIHGTLCACTLRAIIFSSSSALLFHIFTECFECMRWN
jgi:hypothetical protein